jgi:hypothetical protein
MSALLEKARAAVEDRAAVYAPPVENFRRIASYWQDHFAATGRPIKITAADVAPMMILLKLARMNGAHPAVGDPDNLVDIVGYAICHEKISEGQ